MRVEYGARFERGVIRSAGDGGYTVASLDRDGIVTPAIAAAWAPETTVYADDGDGHITISTEPAAGYAVGDMVYYFVFPDGTGKIICGI